MVGSRCILKLQHVLPRKFCVTTPQVVPVLIELIGSSSGFQFSDHGRLCAKGRHASSDQTTAIGNLPILGRTGMDVGSTMFKNQVPVFATRRAPGTREGCWYRSGYCSQSRLGSFTPGLSSQKPEKACSVPSCYRQQVAWMPSTTQIAKDSSETSKHAKYSIRNPTFSQICCDPVGSSAPDQWQANYARLGLALLHSLPAGRAVIGL